jgi:outer membrane protein assembly factor BamD
MLITSPSLTGTHIFFKRKLSCLLLAMLCVALVSGCSSVKKVFKRDKQEVDLSAEELYLQAKTDMSKKNWDTAIKNLRTLEAKFPYGAHALQAQIDTIYVYYRSEQSGLAIASADRFIKINPTHASVDYAYYLKGLSSFNEDTSIMGRITGQDDLSDRDATSILNAMNVFKEVYTLFPNSQYAPDARKRAAELLEALARNEIVVANYYYSRGAYVAVVNRAKGIIENYSSTPSAEIALAQLMFSYEKMGFDDLSSDSRRVLELNFPDSGFLNQTATNVRFTNKYSPKEDKQKKTKADGDEQGMFSKFFSKFKKDPPES